VLNSGHPTFCHQGMSNNDVGSSDGCNQRRLHLKFPNNEEFVEFLLHPRRGLSVNGVYFLAELAKNR